MSLKGNGTARYNVMKASPFLLLVMYIHKMKLYKDETIQVIMQNAVTKKETTQVGSLVGIQPVELQMIEPITLIVSS